MAPTYDELVAFHGHSCPGLAMGFRMSQAALSFLSGGRSADEELVAIVENDACGVDALQYLTGCTFGKGNLIFRDYGKHVYTLYSRRSRRGVRVAFDFSGIPERVLADRENTLPLEYPLEEPSWIPEFREGIIEPIIPDENAQLQPFTKPGLGFEIDEGLLKKYGKRFFKLTETGLKIKVIREKGIKAALDLKKRKERG